jgi:hypothetical protein
MSSWRVALEQLLDTAYAGLEREEIGWAVVGSAASALQGCAIVPDDLDVLLCEAEGVTRFAQLMDTYAPRTCVVEPGEEGWVSSRQQPVSVGPDKYGFVWHFGRWYVDGFKLEAAHIVPPEEFALSADGAGVWDVGPEIWPHIRHVPFAGYQVPVVPLEIQLQTCLRRGLEARAEAIAALLHARGAERELLKVSLSPEHLAWFDRAFADESR